MVKNYSIKLPRIFILLLLIVSSCLHKDPHKYPHIYPHNIYAEKKENDLIIHSAMKIHY